MKIHGSADLSLNANARSELRLRSGDFVFLQVIKRLAENKWAIGIRGRVIPAYARLELVPGQRLRALVILRQGRYQLKLVETPANPVRDLLARQGLSTDREMQLILTSFIRSGLALRPQLLQAVRQYLEKQKLDPKRFSRLVAQVLEKKLDLGSAGMDRLLPVLGYGEEGGGSGRRYRPRQMPADSKDTARDLKSVIEEAQTAEGSPLPLFNHLKGESESWIIVPFDYTFQPSGRVYGTLRLRYNPWQKRTNRVVLCATSETEQRLVFVLDEKEPGERRLHVLKTEKQVFPAAARELKTLGLKLQNLGVKIDDTIHEDEGFDGFSLPWEELSYRNVDTVQ